MITDLIFSEFGLYNGSQKRCHMEAFHRDQK